MGWRIKQSSTGIALAFAAMAALAASAGRRGGERVAFHAGRPAHNAP